MMPILSQYNIYLVIIERTAMTQDAGPAAYAAVSLSQQNTYRAYHTHHTYHTYNAPAAYAAASLTGNILIILIILTLIQGRESNPRGGGRISIIISMRSRAQSARRRASVHGKYYCSKNSDERGSGRTLSVTKSVSRRPCP